MKKREVSLLANSGHNSALNHVKSSVTFWELGGKKAVSMQKVNYAYHVHSSCRREKRTHTRLPMEKVGTLLIIVDVK